MKSILAAAMLSVFVVGALPAFAADKADKPAKAEKAAAGKDVTLKGTMVCAKCALKEAEKCQNVLKVTEDGKETKYYIVHNDIAKKNHGPICSGSANATVKGTVAEEGGKKMVTASEIKYE